MLCFAGTHRLLRSVLTGRWPNAWHRRQTLVTEVLYFVVEQGTLAGPGGGGAWWLTGSTTAPSILRAWTEADHLVEIKAPGQFSSPLSTPAGLYICGCRA